MSDSDVPEPPAQTGTGRRLGTGRASRIRERKTFKTNGKTCLTPARPIEVAMLTTA